VCFENKNIFYRSEKNALAYYTAVVVVVGKCRSCRIGSSFYFTFQSADFQFYLYQQVNPNLNFLDQQVNPRMRSILSLLVFVALVTLALAEPVPEANPHWGGGWGREGWGGGWGGGGWGGGWGGGGWGGREGGGWGWGRR
jgi:hypothetical protein